MKVADIFNLAKDITKGIIDNSTRTITISTLSYTPGSGTDPSPTPILTTEAFRIRYQREYRTRERINVSKYVYIFEYPNDLPMDITITDGSTTYETLEITRDPTNSLYRITVA